MATDKLQLLAEIKEKTEKINKAANLFKVEHIVQYFPLVDNIEKAPARLIREAHKWVIELYNNEYKAVMDVYELLTPTVWAYYNMHAVDFKDHREVALLRDARKNLKAKLKSKPELFHKGVIRNVIEEQAQTKSKKKKK